MRISRFFGDEAVHLDFQQQCSLECGDDLFANAVIEEIFEQGGRFEIGILGWFGAVLLFLAKAILFEKHELFSSGPAQRVAVQTAGKRKGKLPAEQACGCGCREFEEQEKSLLGNVLGAEFLKPSADFAIGPMNGRHEGEDENRLAHLRIANVPSRLDDRAEHFTWRGRAVLAASLRVQVADEGAGIRKRRKHWRKRGDLAETVRAGELLDGGKEVALNPANMTMAIQVLSHDRVS
ncbi:MAG TPA: hypothetical protein VKX49_06695 [Bryobacteraceae bacterium]|nr:hypothetical protein [Bryobacteraceae bacterium]